MFTGVTAVPKQPFRGACVLLQAAAADRERQLEALRADAQAQTRAAKEGAAAAQRALAEVQEAAAADSQRLRGEKSEIERQFKTAQVWL